MTHDWDTADIKLVNLRKLWLAGLVLEADRAVVATNRKDREIQPAIDSGQVFWYQLVEDE